MIFLGKILKVRGNKGEVVYTSPHAAVYPLKPGTPICLKSKKYQKDLAIDYFKEIKGAFVAKLKGVDSINDAMRLIGYDIFCEGTADNDDDVPLDNFQVQDIDGNVWGQVTYLDECSINKLLEIEDETDTYYVPFTDAIVKKIDRRAGLIIIDPPAGLKDLNKIPEPPSKTDKMAPLRAKASSK